MLSALKLSKAADQVTHDALKGRLLCDDRTILVEALEKVIGGDAQRARKLVQHAGRNAISTQLVIMELLRRQTRSRTFGELALGQAKRSPALANARADKPIDRGCARPAHILISGLTGRARLLNGETVAG
jgi:hypothetical protein